MDKQRSFRRTASAETGARQGLEAMFMGRRQVITGLSNRIGVMAV